MTHLSAVNVQDSKRAQRIADEVVERYGGSFKRGYIEYRDPHCPEYPDPEDCEPYFDSEEDEHPTPDSWIRMIKPKR